MKVGIFSVIEWGFLDQRPQVMAKKITEWGHEVHYFEPFFKLRCWDDVSDHPWNEYESGCWQARDVYKGVKAVTMMALPPHKIIKGLMKHNDRYQDKNLDYIDSLGLDFAIVIDPAWGVLLDSIGVPYFYDHVDDTHQMESVLKDVWYENQSYCEKHALTTFYIQPNIARRSDGLYLPNGIEPDQLEMTVRPPVDFDAGCLSAIADWFDIESVLNTQKRLLIIGPMELAVREQYYEYRKKRNNVYWIPRVSRKIGAHWLLRCKSAMVPFRDDHPVVDYVMPLKLVEYLYLGLPPVCYLNKGIEEEFGEFVEFYSSLNWLGLPDLDDAIDRASKKKIDRNKLREHALKFTWDKVFQHLHGVISELGDNTGSNQIFPELVESYVSRVNKCTNGP